MIGSGRHFNVNGFLKKLKEIRGCIIADIESFPDVPFWIVPIKYVKKWWSSGDLGETTKISRKQAATLIKAIAL
ncbi:MAG: hypothetical protein HY547_01680 [Elusimicrobia bacterium]|nr:hypothetical protein [Elusimicrobiota bacterium]